MTKRLHYWIGLNGVGYGDVVPTGTEGRVFATILILAGMALFSVVTANFSVFFISRAEEAGEIEPSQQHIENIDRRLQKIEEHLEQIQRALALAEYRNQGGVPFNPPAEAGP